MDGWKLVPVEPTTEMAEAGCQGYMKADGSAWLMHRSSMEHAYRDMLAAAPTPPNPIVCHVDESCWQGGGEVETCVPVLRAMARNYRNGHSWDHLDGKAVTKAADEIIRLQAEAVRSETHRNELADKIVEQNTTIGALKAEVEQYQTILRTLVEEATCADWSCEYTDSVFHTAQSWCGKFHHFKSRLAKATDIIDYLWLHTELDAIAKSDIDKFYAGSTDAEKAALAEMVRVANEPAEGGL